MQPSEASSVLREDDARAPRKVSAALRSMRATIARRRGPLGDAEVGEAHRLFTDLELVALAPVDAPLSPDVVALPPEIQPRLVDVDHRGSVGFLDRHLDRAAV